MSASDNPMVALVELPAASDTRAVEDGVRIAAGPIWLPFDPTRETPG